MVLPNLIIAGAPKCGTTSLFHWMAAHPEVCASNVKEIRFFMDEGYPLPSHPAARQGLSGYGTFFRQCLGEDKKILLEATPDYLYQRLALQEIPRLNPQPRLIFLLRKPSERIYSLYRFAMNNVSVVDKDTEFTEFLKLVADPRHRLYHDIILRDVVRQTHYIDYLSKWAENVPSGSMLIGLFEHLRSDPKSFMQRICRFAGIDADFFDTFSFPVLNESFVVRNQRLHRFRNRAVGLLPGLPNLSMARKIYRWMNVDASRAAVQAPRTSDDLEALRALDDYFAPFNERLAKAFHLDLASWN